MTEKSTASYTTIKSDKSKAQQLITSTYDRSKQNEDNNGNKTRLQIHDKTVACFK